MRSQPRSPNGTISRLDAPNRLIFNTSLISWYELRKCKSEQEPKNKNDFEGNFGSALQKQNFRRITIMISVGALKEQLGVVISRNNLQVHLGKKDFLVVLFFCDPLMTHV